MNRFQWIGCWDPLPSWQGGAYGRLQDKRHCPEEKKLIGSTNFRTVPLRWPVNLDVSFHYRKDYTVWESFELTNHHSRAPYRVSTNSYCREV